MALEQHNNVGGREFFDSLKKVHQWAAILVQRAHSQRIYVGKHNPINVNEATKLKAIYQLEIIKSS